MQLYFGQNLIPPKVLVAPLDWGLGHATRCIPIIKQLQSAGCTVTIAASGKTLALLTKEFPGILTVQLFGYNIHYSQQKRFLPWKILQQVPKIVLSIIKEHIWLKKVIKEKGLDLVISDNRFGLYCHKIPTVFITHQLRIKAPFAWLEYLIQKINYHFINKFSRCWVPDYEHGDTMAAELSHPKHLPRIPVRYIGPLTRFMPAYNLPEKYRWLVILSGPEPQRTILEEKILLAAPHMAGKVLLIRGKPGDAGTVNAPQNVTAVNHLSTIDMQQAFGESRFVVSRCGYTTVMEVLALQKKAVLIPTPGQTEQEYLAARLFSQHWCYCCQQSDDLPYHFNEAEKFDYKIPPKPDGLLLEEAVKEIIAG